MRTRSQILSDLLVLRIQNGESEALELLVAQWHQRLVGRARSLVHDDEAAKDIAQEAWIGVIRGISKLDDPAKFGGWIHRIVRNKCADWIRKNQSRRAIEGESVEDVQFSERTDRDGRIDSIRDAIQRLPEEQRTILNQFYLNERSIREIAGQLKIPEGTVKSRLFTARNMLKEAMED